jgi:hypothetical protein
LFVTEPASHAAHVVAAAEPVVPTYLPDVQSVHAAALDAIEYFPTAHAVHTVAPLLVPLSVIEPAPHGVHDEPPMPAEKYDNGQSWQAPCSVE